MVHHLVRDSAARSPDAVALVDGGRPISYLELNRSAERFAALCRSNGVRPGDRVLMAIENSVDLVAGYFGALEAGAVAVPLAPEPHGDRLPSAVKDCSPALCVLDAKAARHLTVNPSVFDGRAVFVRTAPGSLKAAASGRAISSPPAETGAPPGLAAIMYTSGSTGVPRGVMLTHRNIVSNTWSIVSCLGLTERDRVMCVLPFSYVYGLSLLHTHVAVGGTVVIDNRFVYPNVVLEAMQQHEVTGFAGVPSTFALLLHRSNLKGMRFPSLRYVTQAGGGMPPARILEWLRDGPQAPFFVMYGATEASARLTCLPAAALPRKLGSIGRPIPGVTMLVVSDDGRTLPAGQVGELVANGPNITAGYWNSPDDTRERFGPLGFRTGDLGYVDDDGYFFLVGRRSDMIKVGGRRVGAKTIEDVLHEHPDVHEAAVVAAPDAVLGEIAVAIVAVRDEAVPDAEALLTLCRRRLAAHEVPARVMFRRDLPKLSGVGKPDKAALRALVSGDIVAGEGPFNPPPR